MALRAARGGDYKVVGVGRNLQKLKCAKKLGAVDKYTTDWASGVRDADIVVMCTPVNLTGKVLKNILPYLKPGAIITDAGSVKGTVLKDAGRVLGGRFSFVGAHPMAGSEKSGVKYSSADMYKNASVVIASDSPAHFSAVKKVKAMWRHTGARIVQMDSRSHDEAVAIISHLPHIIAFTLCFAAEKTSRNNKELPKLIAGSFRDMVRVAGANPADWAVICSANSEAIGKVLASFTKTLGGLNAAIKSPSKLEAFLTKAKTARNKIV